MAFLSDIWFYAYGAGLVVGIGLFVFLRTRFNSAVAGPDSSDLAAEFERRMRAAGMEPEPVKVVTGHPEEAKPKVAAAEPAKPAPAAGLSAAGTARAENDQRAAAPPPASEKKPESGGLTGKTMIGGVSPAIVYLQNLKMQIEHFEKEIQQLRGDVSGFVQKHDSQYSTLLKRLGDLQGEMHQQASPAPAVRPAAQVKAPAAVPAAPAAPKPPPQPVAAPSAPKAAAAMPVVEVLSPIRVPQEAPSPKSVAPAVENTAPIPVQVAAVAAAASAPAPPPADESMSLRPPDENAGKGKAPIWPV